MTGDGGAYVPHLEDVQGLVQLQPAVEQGIGNVAEGITQCAQRSAAFLDVGWAHFNSIRSPTCIGMAERMTLAVAQ